MMFTQNKILLFFHTFQGKILASFLTAYLLTWIVSKPFLSFLTRKKTGQIIRKLGPKSHYSKAGTPSMGGLLFILPPVAIALCFAPLTSGKLWVLILSLLSFSYIGFKDDYLKLIKNNNEGLTARSKFSMQIIFSGFISIAIFLIQDPLLYIPFSSVSLNISYVFIPFAMFVIVSWSNAFNLTDGLDGLATNLMLVLLASLLVMINWGIPGYLHNFIPSLGIDFRAINIFIVCLIASLVVFRHFNISPAKMFMGDTGSLGLGALIASLSLILHLEFILLVVGGVFILEVVSVIIQVVYFKKTKKRFFKMAPLHHHFELTGMSEKKVVFYFTIASILFSALGFLLSLTFKQFIF